MCPVVLNCTVYICTVHFYFISDWAKSCIVTSIYMARGADNALFFTFTLIDFLCAVLSGPPIYSFVVAGDVFSGGGGVLLLVTTLISSIQTYTVAVLYSFVRRGLEYCSRIGSNACTFLEH